MNICLIGDGLISLTLAKTLINNKIKVFMYCNDRKIINDNRTIGITSDNLEFFREEIINIKKSLLWEINKIEIYNDKNKKDKILNFSYKNKTLFSILKNSDLYKLLNSSLKKNKNFKKIIIKDKFFYNKIFHNKNYDLIVNCDPNNEISKRYFYRKFSKNYESKAYTTTINHSEVKNKNATQVFTKYGPIAFLPISRNKTSVVFSVKDERINNNSNLSYSILEKLIFDNNKECNIKSINGFEKFKLKSNVLRSYYFKNVLAFGDILHQIHPLSGQGFNMTLRDIKVFIDCLKYRESLGLPIDNSIFKEFENKTKHLNFIFSSGNDFIYEFFNYDNIYVNKFSKKLFNYLNNSIYFKKFAIKLANKGLII